VGGRWAAPTPSSPGTSGERVSRKRFIQGPRGCTRRFFTDNYVMSLPRGRSPGKVVEALAGRPQPIREGDAGSGATNAAPRYLSRSGSGGSNRAKSHGSGAGGGRWSSSRHAPTPDPRHARPGSSGRSVIGPARRHAPGAGRRPPKIRPRPSSASPSSPSFAAPNARNSSSAFGPVMELGSPGRLG